MIYVYVVRFHANKQRMFSAWLMCFVLQLFAHHDLKQLRFQRLISPTSWRKKGVFYKVSQQYGILPMG